MRLHCACLNATVHASAAPREPPLIPEYEWTRVSSTALSGPRARVYATRLASMRLQPDSTPFSSQQAREGSAADLLSLAAGGGSPVSGRHGGSGKSAAGYITRLQDTSPPSPASGSSAGGAGGAVGVGGATTRSRDSSPSLAGKLPLAHHMPAGVTTWAAPVSSGGAPEPLVDTTRVAEVAVVPPMIAELVAPRVTTKIDGALRDWVNAAGWRVATCLLCGTDVCASASGDEDRTGTVVIHRSVAVTGDPTNPISHGHAAAGPTMHSMGGYGANQASSSTSAGMMHSLSMGGNASGGGGGTWYTPSAGGLSMSNMGMGPLVGPGEPGVGFHPPPHMGLGPNNNGYNGSNSNYAGSNGTAGTRPGSPVCHGDWSVSPAFEIAFPRFLSNPWQATPTASTPPTDDDRQGNNVDQGEKDAEQEEPQEQQERGKGGEEGKEKKPDGKKGKERRHGAPGEAVGRVTALFGEFSSRLEEELRRDVEAYRMMRDTERRILLARAETEREAMLATMAAVAEAVDRCAEAAGKAGKGNGKQDVGGSHSSGESRIGGLPASMFSSDEDKKSGGKAGMTRERSMTQVTKDVAPALFALEVSEGKLVDIDTDAVVLGDSGFIDPADDLEMDLDMAIGGPYDNGIGGDDGSGSDSDDGPTGRRLHTANEQQAGSPRSAGSSGKRAVTAASMPVNIGGGMHHLRAQHGERKDDVEDQGLGMLWSGDARSFSETLHVMAVPQRDRLGSGL